MNKSTKAAIVIGLVVVIAGVMIAKQINKSKSAGQPQETRPSVEVPASISSKVKSEQTSNADVSKELPRLVDLGADKCIPCKMMAPILEELKTEYEGRLEVEFIDVWKNPGAGREYAIRVIPTQIFYNEKGKELFRHEGFFSKADILGKWKEFGIELVKEK
ncbi:MAG: thioredoxin family protein [Planctomycetota bacterium]|jgi:thioredoxin 1